MSAGLQPDTVFVSDLLPRRHPALAEQLTAALPRRPRLIPGTRDIWCRDYMPVQVNPRRFVQFRYRPDYLRGRPDLRTTATTIPAGLSTCRQSNLAIDGGNVVRLGTTAILTDKIYRENRRLGQAALRERLREELEVEKLIIIPAEPGDVLGHADGVLRFIDERTGLVNDYRQLDPGYGKRVGEMLHRHNLDLVLCPYAPTAHVGPDGIPSAVGVYVNFLLAADTLVCPAYGLPEDDEALGTLTDCFPGRRIVPLRCGALADEGGALHCVTWNVTNGRDASRSADRTVHFCPAMEFMVSDRESVEDGLLVRSAYVVISIRDPGKRPALIPRQAGLRDVLHLAFHDAEPVSNLRLPDDIRLMTPKQAREIWAFVRLHDGNIGTVVVHCEQGMSRSPAVAAALCKGMGGDDRRFWREHQPNQYVYRLMISAGNASKGDEHDHSQS